MKAQWHGALPVHLNGLLRPSQAHCHCRRPPSPPAGCAPSAMDQDALRMSTSGLGWARSLLFCSICNRHSATPRDLGGGMLEGPTVSCPHFPTSVQALPPPILSALGGHRRAGKGFSLCRLCQAEQTLLTSPLLSVSVCEASSSQSLRPSTPGGRWPFHSLTKESHQDTRHQDHVKAN